MAICLDASRKTTAEGTRSTNQCLHVLGRAPSSSGLLEPELQQNLERRVRVWPVYILTFVKNKGIETANFSKNVQWLSELLHK